MLELLASDSRVEVETGEQVAECPHGGDASRGLFARITRQPLVYVDECLYEQLLNLHVDVLLGDASGVLRPTTSMPTKDPGP
jgi:hypothetical protein